MINSAEPASGVLLFKLESEILSQITHPQIPGFVEAFSEGDMHYIVQEYIEGLPLSYLIENGCRFSEADVKGMVLQLLSILNDLHCPPQKKDAVVHRDLRLSNLLLQNDKLFLVDFGFARFIDLSRNVFCPDPLENKFYCNSGSDRGFLNPAGGVPFKKKMPGIETYRLLRREVSPRSDLFGAGAVAVDLFTSWVEDESLFNRCWQDVLNLSDPFIVFLEKLLSREGGFETAASALEYLGSVLEYPS